MITLSLYETKAYQDEIKRRVSRSTSIRKTVKAKGKNKRTRSKSSK